MKVQMTSVLYDGLQVTIEGDERCIANFLHETMAAGVAAMRVGVIKDQCGRVQWRHNDPEAVAAFRQRLQTNEPVEVFNVQDPHIGFDGFRRID